MNNKTKLPFLFGAQYYRAPTPEKEFWAQDLSKMKELGFNQVKYWLQWRWQHRGVDRYYWDDLDRLMDLAGKNGIGVTLNIIMDVAPIWLYEKYPDAMQIDVKGNRVEPFAVQHRQIGGHPGPCYNHPRALEERKKFCQVAIEHYRAHPAMQMWDVWNEPEQSYPRRSPEKDDLTCFCAHCRKRFIEWMQNKYGTIEHVNDVWGRCYEKWEQIEIPLTHACVTDFIDWREFHLDTMTAEAVWKLEMARKLDPKSVSYLHVVPNTMTFFNSSTGVDDFDMAEHCDVWAATMNQNPLFTTQVISAARGRVSYNVESHVNFGSLANHQRILGLPDLLKDWLPQVGLGVKGFLFWQFRPEVIGTESPAWGLVKPDGSDRPITEAARTFWKTISPHAEALMNCAAAQGEIGIYKSRKNELFHFCMDRTFANLAGSVDTYLQHLYWMNYRTRFVSGQMLERGDLAGIKLLILPAAMYMTQLEVDQLKKWVSGGGVVLCEAHLASYDGTRGRHARQTPGMGLIESWGIREVDSISSRHLKVEQTLSMQKNLAPDEAKALMSSGAVGGDFVPIRLNSGTIAWGGSRYAILDAPGTESLGSFDGENPSLVTKRIGAGTVVYCASHLGQGAKRDSDGFREMLRYAADRAGIETTLRSSNPSFDIHVDELKDQKQQRFIFIWNRSDTDQQLKLELDGRLTGMFSDQDWKSKGQTLLTIPARFSDLMKVDSQN